MFFRSAFSHVKLPLVVALTLIASSCQSQTPSSSGSPAQSATPAGPQTTWERIQEEGSITFAHGGEPPYGFEEAGEVTGSDAETLKAIMTGYGITNFEGLLVDFAGLIPGLLAERFDVVAAGVGITPERCEQVAFANPIAEVHTGLAVKAGNPKDLHSLEDIAADPSATVAAPEGALQIAWLTAAGVADEQVLKFPNAQTQMQALQADRVDAAIMFLPLIEAQMRVLNDPSIELADPFETPTTAEGRPGITFWALVVRQEDTDLLDALNEGMAELHSSGALLGILEDWGYGESALPSPDLTAEQVCAGDF